MIDPGLPPLGATPLPGGGCRFLVWGPRIRRMEVRLPGPPERLVPLVRSDDGYHRGEVEDAPPGTLYLYRLDGEYEAPDPASRSQPRGVHGPSAVAGPSFGWTDTGYPGFRLEESVTYEIHVGTFSPEGTFAGVIPHLDRLAGLGVTAIELMPVAAFPGTRNWGYDGVFPYAVQESYGGPAGLRGLVDACHARGLALVLDVVYNHLGPEGNVLGVFAPYFTDRYRTPWGPAVNLDGPESDEVRRYFIRNALEWFRDFHVDALRLDAVHAFLDRSAHPFLKELAEETDALAARTGRRLALIAESNLNDARLIRPRERGGYGLTAQWSDDFHHALHTLLTGERSGYYEDFGETRHLEKALANGFVYTGEYSAYRRRRHGNRCDDIDARRFVIAAQTHDQIGNRRLGERLIALAGPARARLAAAALLLAPYPPLLFMGEEYGEDAPFLYFVSHSDPGLVDAVRRGRREEFRAFGWEGEVPDPHAESTFARSRIDPARAEREPHRRMLAFYRELLRLRRTHPALRVPNKNGLAVRGSASPPALWFRRRGDGGDVLVVLSFHDEPAEIEIPSGPWRRILSSADPEWGGPGGGSPGVSAGTARWAVTLPPWSAAAFERGEEDGAA